MTRCEWHFLLGFWCEVFEIDETPRLEIVPTAEMGGVDAFTEYYDALANGWVIKVRAGRHTNPSVTMCHECLHVKSGCTDQVHEKWIQRIADVLEAWKP